MIKKVMRKLVKVYYMYIRHDAAAYARHLGVRMGKVAKSLQILRLHLVQSRG